MWYVIQVYTGKELEIAQQCRDRVADEGEDVFVPLAERWTKIRGERTLITSRLFPGYVFIETDYPEAVYLRLEETPQNLLFSNQHHVSVLDDTEAAFIEQVTDQRGTVGISDIRIDKDREIKYLSGPLTRVSSRVKKVNLHKRVAEVGLNVSGKQQTLWLGVRF